MVSGGVSQNALALLLGSEFADGIVSTPKLEAAGLLKVLAFEQHLNFWCFLSSFKLLVDGSHLR